MGIFILSTTFLICVTWSTIFTPGAAISIKKALNIGDDITLECVTDWNPNITLYWVQRAVGSLGDRYIATAGPQDENGFILQRLREESYFLYSYENVSSSEIKIALALYISNISEKDSANYTCVSYKKGTLDKLLYTYDVRAIDCNCSLESNAVCDLFGLHLSDPLTVSIRVDGRTVTGMVNNSRLELSSRLLNKSTPHHSIELSSSDGILSNISCTLSTESSQSSTQTMTTFFPIKIPQSSTDTVTMFFPTHSNPSSTRKTNSALFSQPNPSSAQKTTSVFPSQPDPSSTQNRASVYPSRPDPSSVHATTVFPSQPYPSSTPLMYLTQVQHGITTYQSGSKRKIIIAFSIIMILVLSFLVTFVVLVTIKRRKLRSQACQLNLGYLEGTLNMTRNPMHAGKEDSALPYPNRLQHIPQHINDASASPGDYEEVDDYLQGEDNSCCTVLNVENEYTYLYMAPIEREIGMDGYTALIVSDENASGNLAPIVSDENASGNFAPIVSDENASGNFAPIVSDENASGNLAPNVSDENASGNLAPSVSDENALGNVAPSVTGENREDTMSMGPSEGDVESDAEGYVVCNVTRGEEICPVPNVTGLGASRITSSNMNENDYLALYTQAAIQCRYDLLLHGGGRRNYETRRGEEEERFVISSVAAKTIPTDLAPIEKNLQE